MLPRLWHLRALLESSSVLRSSGPTQAIEARLDESRVLRRPLPEPFAELIAARLRILGQPVRLRLLDLVDLKPDLTIQELASLLGTTQQNVSHHLGILFRAGVLGRRREGTHVRYFLEDQHILPLLEEAAASITRQLTELSRMVEPDSS